MAGEEGEPELLFRGGTQEKKGFFVLKTHFFDGYHPFIDSTHKNKVPTYTEVSNAYSEKKNHEGDRREKAQRDNQMFERAVGGGFR